MSKSEKKKAHTTTTERKSIMEKFFWPQRKTFQAGGGYKNPIKTRKATIHPPKSFPLWTPLFLQKEKVLHWSRAVFGFFFRENQCSGLFQQFLPLWAGFWEGPGRPFRDFLKILGSGVLETPVYGDCDRMICSVKVQGEQQLEEEHTHER